MNLKIHFGFICAASCAEAGCDVLVCIQPTISDGRLAPIIAQQWGKGDGSQLVVDLMNSIFTVSIFSVGVKKPVFTF